MPQKFFRQNRRRQPTPPPPAKPASTHNAPTARPDRQSTAPPPAAKASLNRQPNTATDKPTRRKPPAKAADRNTRRRHHRRPSRPATATPPGQSSTATNKEPRRSSPRRERPGPRQHGAGRQRNTKDNSQHSKHPQTDRQNTTDRDDRHGQGLNCAGAASAMPRSPLGAALAAGLRAVGGTRAIMVAPWRHYPHVARARRRPFATKQINFN